MTPDRQCKAKPTDRGEEFPMPGDRVLAFDHRLYRDDASTPPSVTFRPATVLARYGTESRRFGRYPDLVDLLFDHRPESPSRAHFTRGVHRLTGDSGRQQGVSTPECPPVERQSEGTQGEQAQQVRLERGRLAQSVEQRTFNPRATRTPAQPDSKRGGFSRDSGAIRAPGCARLHVDRVSGGCQEGLR